MHTKRLDSFRVGASKKATVVIRSTKLGTSLREIISSKLI